MEKKFSTLSTVMSSVPLVLASGALLLFVVGYCAHKLCGDNNPVEELAEDLLKKDYDITVEFSHGR